MSFLLNLILLAAVLWVMYGFWLLTENISASANVVKKWMGS